MSGQKPGTLPQLRQFPEFTSELEFRGCGTDEDRYRHIEGVLRRFGYVRRKRTDKGLVVRYLMRTTGYSRQQLVRLLKRARVGPLQKVYRAPANGNLRRSRLHKLDDVIKYRRQKAQRPGERAN